jgi:hypothetical protein
MLASEHVISFRIHFWFINSSEVDFLMVSIDLFCQYFSGGTESFIIEAPNTSFVFFSSLSYLFSIHVNFFPSH